MSSTVLKISVILQVRSINDKKIHKFIAQVKLLKLSTHAMKYFLYLPKKKVNFSFLFFPLKGKP